jgi:hypothetical protein
VDILTDVLNNRVLVSSILAYLIDEWKTINVNISAARRENGDENLLKGCTDVPVYNDIDIESGEDWEAGNFFKFHL